MHDDRDRNDLQRRLSETNLTRRGFVVGVGALSLAGLVPVPRMLGEEGLDVERHRRPRLGALFNPYHRPEVWSVLTAGRPEGMPWLGAYDSGSVGGSATQIAWARQMGLDFFLADYCYGRSSSGVEALFEAAARADFKVGLSIDLQDASGAAGRTAPEGRLQAAMLDISKRFLSHPAYLRTSHGQPVLGIVGAGGGMRLEQAASSPGGEALGGIVLLFPTEWRWQADTDADRRLVEEMAVLGAYPGFSLHSTGKLASRLLPSRGTPTHAVLMAPARDEARGVVLPPLPAAPESGEESLVILDSFNHWGISIPLEPGTKSRQRYVKEVASWSRTYDA